MKRDYTDFLPQRARDAGARTNLNPLQALGWQPFFAQQISVDELTATPPARVVEVHRNGLHVLGDSVDDILPPRPDVTVGDWLMLKPSCPQSSRVLERTSLIKRRAPGTDRQEQLIAANIDTAFIVTSCNQDFKVARLERYAALAFEAGITPVIVVTETDLATDPQSYTDAARAVSEMIEVVALDARGSAPRKHLSSWCRSGKTVAFLGSSGVGKSTLTNALLESQSIETQAIREDDAKGRHTTKRRELHAMLNGCLILDTPGMRELQLTDAADGINDLFADIQELAAGCRFNDCQHETEPGCAVLKAVEQGTLDAVRLGRWRKLLAEDAFNSASLAERRSRDKAFGKMVRGVKKHRDVRRKCRRLPVGERIGRDTHCQRSKQD
ncbi:ribosome small subunit-dependent GTPase A [Ruegeria sp. HKCCD4332]|uniref:ribosome small subunit-dependent GTPase A n=1 Tax=Ruegeria sp. HKCCD4332 TaxID=2683021 RepID=UPI001491BFCF|nr:ribosome small subunit-dependent GTPase A [Ruegeria sp. HKCCD4332]NOD76723.1 ribosome small subunit-dependent GTPase A [Ruegeria sp. HKCCD4332]